MTRVFSLLPSQSVVAAGVCKPLVRLLGHPSVLVRTPALRTVGNITMGDELQVGARPIEWLAITRVSVCACGCMESHVLLVLGVWRMLAASM